MSIFTAIGRVLRFAGNEVLDVVTDVITRRADDDLVDITPEVDDDFQDLGALENLGQAEPQMTINITPEQQAGIDAIRERNAEILRNTIDVESDGNICVKFKSELNSRPAIKVAATVLIAKTIIIYLIILSSTLYFPLTKINEQTRVIKTVHTSTEIISPVIELAIPAVTIVTAV